MLYKMCYICRFWSCAVLDADERGLSSALLPGSALTTLALTSSQGLARVALHSLERPYPW